MDINFSSLKIRTDAQPVDFLKDLALSPLIYIRLVGILFSIIVFGCMADQGIIQLGDGEKLCRYGANSGACSYALAIGVLAFLICIVFLFKDGIIVLVDFSGAILIKKVLMVVDIAVNGFWMLLWFIGFCFTTDQYRRNQISLPSSVENCLRATITFSFFSILLWASIIGLNVFYLVWIMRGTDRDTRPSNYSGFQGQEPLEKEDHDEEPSPSPTGGTYEPPNYDD